MHMITVTFVSLRFKQSIVTWLMTAADKKMPVHGLCYSETNYLCAANESLSVFPRFHWLLLLHTPVLAFFFFNYEVSHHPLFANSFKTS